MSSFKASFHQGGMKPTWPEPNSILIQSYSKTALLGCFHWIQNDPNSGHLSDRFQQLLLLARGPSARSTPQTSQPLVDSYRHSHLANGIVSSPVRSAFLVPFEAPWNFRTSFAIFTCPKTHQSWSTSPPQVVFLSAVAFFLYDQLKKKRGQFRTVSFSDVQRMV